jgi:hypothetical protein
MFEAEDSNTAGEGVRYRLATINEATIRSEVLFWRELIAGCGPEQPPESIERMRQALALAESRLGQLLAAGQQARARGAEPPARVYCLDAYRRNEDGSQDPDPGPC